MNGLKELQDLCDEIAECKDCNCVGKPVVLFRNGVTTEAKIMVITEQPKGYFDLTDNKKHGINASIESWEKDKRATPKKIDKYFDNNFFDGIKNGLVYWTHYVKCPSVELSNKCANKWLQKEIEYFAKSSPLTVITFGKASEYIYNHLIPNQQNLKKNQQISNIIREMTEMKKDNYKVKIPDDKEIIFLPLFHPSNENRHKQEIEKYSEYKNEIKNIFICVCCQS